MIIATIKEEYNGINSTKTIKYVEGYLLSNMSGGHYENNIMELTQLKLLHTFMLLHKCNFRMNEGTLHTLR